MIKDILIDFKNTQDAIKQINKCLKLIEHNGSDSEFYKHVLKMKKYSIRKGEIIKRFLRKQRMQNENE